MPLKTIGRWRTRTAAIGASAIVALAPVAAHAAAVTMEYDAIGTSYIARTGSSIALGPTTLTTNIDTATGDFTGSLPLPGTTTTFSVGGLIPVTADVDF